MSGFAAHIKSTPSAAITDVKTNLMVLTEKLASTEATEKQRDRAIHRLERVTVSQSQHFIDIKRHL